VDGENIEL
jgi:hypothetical protein